MLFLSFGEGERDGGIREAERGGRGGASRGNRAGRGQVLGGAFAYCAPGPGGRACGPRVLLAGRPVIAPAVEAEGYDGPIEVSSPGIERPLTRPEHFRRFVGHQAKVRIGEPLDGRRNFTGVIDRTGEDAFVLRLSEGAEVELPFGSVTRANLKEDIYK